MQCIYPLGVTDNANLIVRRQASEVANLKRKRKKKHKQKEVEVRYISPLDSSILIGKSVRLAVKKHELQ